MHGIENFEKVHHVHLVPVQVVLTISHQSTRDQETASALPYPTAQSLEKNLKSEACEWGKKPVQLFLKILKLDF